MVSASKTIQLIVLNRAYIMDQLVHEGNKISCRLREDFHVPKFILFVPQSWQFVPLDFPVRAVRNWGIFGCGWSRGPARHFPSWFPTCFSWLPFAPQTHNAHPRFDSAISSANAGGVHFRGKSFWTQEMSWRRSSITNIGRITHAKLSRLVRRIASTTHRDEMIVRVVSHI